MNERQLDVLTDDPRPLKNGVALLEEIIKSPQER
jgi:hypothetical protein